MAIFELDGRALLFCEGQQRLYALEPEAATVWRALAGAPEPGGSAAPLPAGPGLPRRRADDHLASCLAQWAEAGLLDAGDEGQEAPAPAEHPDAGPAGLAGGDVFALAGFRVRVGCADESVVGAVRSVFGHLAVRDGAADFGFATVAGNGAYRLLGPDGVDRPMLDAAAVAVWLKTDIVDAILRRRGQTMAIHAAALATPAGALVLAGRSGSGKSTLAALFNAAGWPLIADDVVLLDAGHPRIGGLPLAFAVKPGSWPVLRDAFPAVGAAITYDRPDGRRVRYLPPATIADTGEGVEVRSVVFPTFSQGAATDIRPLSRAEALVRVLGDARNDARRLTTGALLNLATLLRRSAVRELTFGDAHDAVEALAATAGAVTRPPATGS